MKLRASNNARQIAHRFRKNAKTKNEVALGEGMFHFMKHSSQLTQDSFFKNCVRVIMPTVDAQYLSQDLRQVSRFRNNNRQKDANVISAEIREKFGSYRNIARISKATVKYVHSKLNPPKKKPEHKATVEKNLRKEEVIAFLNQDCITFTLPGKKHANKRFMRDTWENTYAKYLLQTIFHKHGKVSISTMREYKPKNIILSGKAPLTQCECIYCDNFNMIRKSLLAIGMKGIFSNKHKAVQQTMCPDRVCQLPSNHLFHKKLCMDRNCDDCVIDNFKLNLKEKNVKLFEENFELNWFEWLNTKQESNAPLKVLKRAPLDVVVDRYIEHLMIMPRHLFRSDWHRNLVDILKLQLKRGIIIQHMDFAQNYQCRYDTEIQDNYWTGTQVTIHGLINYYTCPNEECKKVVTDYLVHISDDMKHDSFVSRAAQKKSGDYLLSKYLDINLLVQFSDNCASQYKSRRPFAEMSRNPIPIVRIFFGEKHGKGAVDGLFGRIKNWIDYNVRCKQFVVSTAEEFLQVCQDNYVLKTTHRTENCPLDHVFIKFDFLYPRDIRRKQDCDLEQGIPGTRSFYMVKNTPNMLELKVKHVPCVCRGCLFDDGPCINEEFSDPWQVVKLEPVKGESTTKHEKQRDPRKHRDEIVTDISSEDEAPENPSKGSNQTDVQETGESNGSKYNTRGMARMAKLLQETSNDVSVTDEGTSAIFKNDNVCASDKGPKIREDDKDIEEILIECSDEYINPSIKDIIYPHDERYQSIILHGQDDLDIPNNPDDSLVIPIENVITAGTKGTHIKESVIKSSSQHKKPKSTRQDKRSKSTSENQKSRSKQKPVINSTTEVEVKEEICDEVYWRSICSALKDCCSLEEFGRMVAALEDSGLRSLPELDIPSFDSKVHNLDEIARLERHIYPEDMEPIHTEGDGNCFCRALSLACFGTDKHHRQLRARIAMEGYKNMKKYLTNSYLERGARVINGGTMTGVFAYYSAGFANGIHLDAKTVEAIYTMEILQVAGSGIYTGIWQFVQASTVLNLPIRGYRPRRGTIWADFDRTFYPVTDDLGTGNDDRPTINIMWTAMVRGGNLIHFVPLLSGANVK